MSDVTITGVEPHLVENPWKPWAFVTVETDAGVTGVGEATLPRNALTIEAAIREEAEYYIGADPFETEQLYLKMYRDRGGMMPHMVNMAVISAMDMACWDIKGKILDQPVYELLGGSVHGDRLPAYANGWYTNTDGDPEAFADAAKRVVDDGYDALKFDPFGVAWRRMDPTDRQQAIDIVAAVREAVGSEVELMIEAHYRFEPDAARDIAQRLEPYDPAWFEQPVPGDSRLALERVAKEVPVPIAVDRSPETGIDFDLLSAGVDIVQPDLIYTGGITNAKKIAAVADTQYVSFAPHNAQGPVSTAACAHVDATAPNFRIQEVFEDYAHPNWADRLVERSLDIADGHVELPSDAGLGVELDMDAVREYSYGEHSEDVDIMNLFKRGWEDRSFDE